MTSAAAEQAIADKRSSGRDRRWSLTVLVIAALAGGTGAFFLARAGRIASLAEASHRAYQAKDWARVEDLAGRWRWWQRREAMPLIYLAEAALQTNQSELAVELLDQLPDDDPRTPKALLERSGMLFGQLNRPIEGAETLERALRLDPALAEARRRLVYFYAFTLQRRKMVHHAYEAIHRNCDLPETYVYLMLQDWLSFANAYAENTKWLQNDREEELFLVARAVYRITTRSLDEPSVHGKSPRDEEGSLYHRKVVATYFEIFPKNIELLAYLVDRACVDGNTDEVTRLLSGAPAKAAADNRFWRFKGWLHGARGELAEAEGAFQKAISLNCYDYASRHQLANLLRRLRRADEAKALTELSKEGREIRRVLYALESVAKVPRNVMQRMAKYAKDCGDTLVAEKLALRLKTMFDLPVPETAAAGAGGQGSGSGGQGPAVGVQGSGAGTPASAIPRAPGAKTGSNVPGQQ